MSYTRIELIPAAFHDQESKTVNKNPDKTPYLLQKDETELLKIYRKAKRMGYADISVTIQEGSRVKLWLTEKIK